MHPQASQRRDMFSVVQIALGVAMNVFLVAIYVRSVHPFLNEQAREIRTQQMVYVVDVKYLPSDTKWPP